MAKFFTNTYPSINLHKKASIRSEIVTQMIYGDSFSIIKKNNKWLKIKIKEDGYLGFIQNKNYKTYLKPTHKINKLKAKVYKSPNKQKKVNILAFGSKIRVIDKQSKFLKFDKGWINQNEVKPLPYRQKDPFKRINIFKNIKYKWGGKSFKGIDCSALIQVFLNFNNKYCPRDTKDQIKYSKGKLKKRKYKKGDIIFWKGHVAICLNSKELIHAYGPEKKVLIMPITKTINRIKKTANLEVKKVARIKY